MRFENMTTTHICRALDLYVVRAWGTLDPGPLRELADGLHQCHEVDELLELFEQDASETYSDGSGRGGFRRYVIRLGNKHYPFMKLVIQEYLLNGEFFFSVDTHDNLAVDSTNPEYAEWRKLMRRNRELKIEIEADWAKAGLPTHADLQVLMEQLASEEQLEAKGRRLLIVDDESHVAMGLKALLTARGYSVEVAFDGHSALEKLREEPAPDLLLLDNDMPEMDGQEVLRWLRKHERLFELPVLMTTAAQILPQNTPGVSGFLRKPYPRQVLFEKVESLLRRTTS
jgi:CheY-like chemotaxis protein